MIKIWTISGISSLLMLLIPNATGILEIDVEKCHLEGKTKSHDFILWLQ